MSWFEFAGGVAFVTGAASGIGASTCVLLVENGIKSIALCDINPKALAAFEARLKGTNPSVECLSITCDVSDSQQCFDAVQQTVTAFGRIDFACLCAGIGMFANEAGQLDTSVTELDKLHRILNINLNGTVYCLTSLIKAISAQEPRPSAFASRIGIAPQRASIVTISSVLGQRGNEAALAYVASKHAVIGATKSTAMQGAALGIRVNSVAPGFIRTGIWSITGSMEAAAVATLPHTPLRRIAHPDEVAQVILFQLSPLSSFVTGATWNVDGGYCIV